MFRKECGIPRMAVRGPRWNALPRGRKATSMSIHPSRGATALGVALALVAAGLAGAAPADAATSVQAAIDAAPAGGTVRLAPGTYRLPFDGWATYGGLRATPATAADARAYVLARNLWLFRRTLGGPDAVEGVIDWMRINDAFAGRAQP